MKYTKPEFDVTIYEVEDILTASSSGEETTTIGYGNEAEGGTDGWNDFGDF